MTSFLTAMVFSALLGSLAQAQSCPDFSPQIIKCDEAREEAKKVCNDPQLTQKEGGSEEKSVIDKDKFSCKGAGAGGASTQAAAREIASCYQQRRTELGNHYDECRSHKTKIREACNLAKSMRKENLEVPAACQKSVEDTVNKMADMGAEGDKEVMAALDKDNELIQKEQRLEDEANLQAGQSLSGQSDNAKGGGVMTADGTMLDANKDEIKGGNQYSEAEIPPSQPHDSGSANVVSKPSTDTTSSVAGGSDPSKEGLSHSGGPPSETAKGGSSGASFGSAGQGGLEAKPATTAPNFADHTPTSTPAASAPTVSTPAQAAESPATAVDTATRYDGSTGGGAGANLANKGGATQGRSPEAAQAQAPTPVPAPATPPPAQVTESPATALDTATRYDGSAGGGAGANLANKGGATQGRSPEAAQAQAPTPTTTANSGGGNSGIHETAAPVNSTPTPASAAAQEKMATQVAAGAQNTQTTMNPAVKTADAAGAPSGSTSAPAMDSSTQPSVANPNSPRSTVGGTSPNPNSPGLHSGNGNIADTDSNSSAGGRNESDNRGGNYGSRAKRIVENVAMGLFMMAGNIIGNSGSEGSSSTNITVVNNNYTSSPGAPTTPPSNEPPSSPVTPVTPPLNPSNPPGYSAPPSTPPVVGNPTNPADPTVPTAPVNPTTPVAPVNPATPAIVGTPTNPADPTLPPAVAAKASPGGDKAVAASAAAEVTATAAGVSADGRAPASVMVSLKGQQPVDSNAPANAANAVYTPEGPAAENGGEALAAGVAGQPVTAGEDAPNAAGGIGTSVKKLIAWVSGEPTPAPRLLNTAVGGFTGKQLHAASADMFGKIQNRYKALEPTLIKDP